KIPALGIAEVSLTISNETNILPIDYQEVTITRRLYRSGESEYLLNNNIVRLKDINELLMGTGIGAESYSLVEQGKIDLVLSSKPEDRRLVFDEATGVSKYKAKKKEALRKLEDTENNLLRVNDIIQEVKRQINSIERQANKARRYKEVFEKLKELEIKLALEEINNLKAQYEEIKNTETSLNEKITNISTNLNELSNKISVHQEEIESLNQLLLNLNNESINTENLIERKSQHIKMNEERILELNKRLQVIETQKDNLNKRIIHAKENLEKIEQKLTKIKEESQEKQNLLETKESKFKEIEKIIRHAQERIKLANSRTFEIAIDKTRSNNELIDTSSSLNTLNARKQRLETELLKIKQESETGESELNNIKEQVEEIRGNFQNIKSKIGALVKSLNGKKEEIENAEDEINKLKEAKIILLSQKEFLQELKLKFEDMPSSKEAEIILRDIEGVNESEISGIIAKAKSVSFDRENKTYRIICEAKLFSLDIKLLEEKINQIELQLQEKNNVLNSQKGQAQQLEQETEILKSDLQKEQIILADKEAVLKNCQSNYEKISEELSLLQFEQKDVDENIDKLSTRKEAFQGEIENLNQENTNQEDIINTSQSEISTNSKLRESLLLEITQLKTQLDSVTTKENDLSTTFSMLERSLLAENEALKAQEEEKSNSEIRIAQLKDESINLKTEIESLTSKSNQIQNQLKVKNQELSEKGNILKELRNEENEKKTQVAENKENLHQYQLNIQENTFKLNQIKERMLQVYQYNIDQTEQVDQIIDFEKAAVKQEIESLRKKVDNFGTVNLVAIEELEELKQRYDFLEHQQMDLNTAKDSLNEAIRKINRTTKKMFLDTFQMVAKEFKNYFRLLFGGGDAELFLIDEEDVLESGIEIVCRPPGKKLQNILLLSGGEKSLSAIALIFAIFKTKPAPFCVLDEIDAALDELNVDRFSRMLKEFAKISQFIVITHNKKTIIHADVMYGITMEQSGISKIVSVKLSENENKKRAPSKKDKTALSTVDTN
ncbi:hypothetical protein HQ550_03525, partial [bacterium]|nr:hypothetical protein [bacterium]